MTDVTKTSTIISGSKPLSPALGDRRIKRLAAIRRTEETRLAKYNLRVKAFGEAEAIRETQRKIRIAALDEAERIECLNKTDTTCPKCYLIECCCEEDHIEYLKSQELEIQMFHSAKRGSRLWRKQSECPCT
jgi:hypothetical protein